MLCAEFIAAVHDAGVPYGLPWREHDRAVAAMLEVEESTARRWRLGLSEVPGPAAMALCCMAKLRTAGLVI